MAVWEGEQQRSALQPSLRGRYARGAHAQLGHLLLKDLRAYWRTPEYNATRLTISAGVALIFGTMYWKKAHRRCAAFPGRRSGVSQQIDGGAQPGSKAQRPYDCQILSHLKMAVEIALSWLHVPILRSAGSPDPRGYNRQSAWTHKGLLRRQGTVILLTAALQERINSLLLPTHPGVACRSVPKDVLNIEGALYFCTFFLGIVNSLIVQPVVAAERTVFYRERAAHMYSVLPYVLSLVCAWRLQAPLACCRLA